MATRAELVKNAGKVKPDEASNAANPKVYFDIKIGNINAGRITFEVGLGHVKVAAAKLSRVSSIISLECFDQLAISRCCVLEARKVNCRSGGTLWFCCLD